MSRTRRTSSPSTSAPTLNRSSSSRECSAERFSATMTEEDFRRLCEECDRVLMTPPMSPERMAIVWLHVLREHPMVLETYGGSPSSRRAQRRLWLRFLAGWVRRLATAVRQDGSLWSASRDLDGGVDVLFLSHLTNSGQAGKGADAYFGE